MWVTTRLESFSDYSQFCSVHLSLRKQEKGMIMKIINFYPPLTAGFKIRLYTDCFKPAMAIYHASLKQQQRNPNSRGLVVHGGHGPGSDTAMSPGPQLRSAAPRATRRAAGAFPPSLSSPSAAPCPGTGSLSSPRQPSAHKSRRSPKAAHLQAGLLEYTHQQSNVGSQAAHRSSKQRVFLLYMSAFPAEKKPLKDVPQC